MHKFDAACRHLEVCAIAKHCPGFLNRQVITLLMASCLGVPDDAFRRLQVRQRLNRHPLLDSLLQMPYAAPV